MEQPECNRVDRGTPMEIRGGAERRWGENGGDTERRWRRNGIIREVRTGVGIMVKVTTGGGRTSIGKDRTEIPSEIRVGEILTKGQTKKTVAKRWNTRVGIFMIMGIRGNKISAAQKSECGKQTREEEGKRSTRPEAQRKTASAKPEGQRASPSIRAIMV